MKFILATLSIFMLSSCIEQEPALTPLSEREKITLSELKVKFEKKKKEYSDYKSEKERVNLLQTTYLQDYISLNDFSIYKTNKFDDGRDRACYKGILENKGKEIVDEIHLKVNFYSDSTGDIIHTWDVALVDANDEFLDNSEASEAKSLILALSGRKLPLKPNAKLNLTKGKTCLSDVFLDWQAKDVKYEITKLKLRPKLAEVGPLDSLKISVEIFPLEERAKKFNQL
ncbi:hypothetical protein [Colwellia sp. UCD-KL20]|uniref:hypothetical protein n=1 Tax=Colwellia sp. UCD-KL20 TaxID=1917165 RepID=UPI0009706641|nr:hypothetical protein [Colwellia sp. UCD-KL20]